MSFSTSFIISGSSRSFSRSCRSPTSPAEPNQARGKNQHTTRGKKQVPSSVTKYMFVVMLRQTRKNTGRLEITTQQGTSGLGRRLLYCCFSHSLLPCVGPTEAVNDPRRLRRSHTLSMARVGFAEAVRYEPVPTLTTSNKKAWGTSGPANCSSLGMEGKTCSIRYIFESSILNFDISKYHV